MDGLYIEKNAWKFTDETQRQQVRCEFDDEDVAVMQIGLPYTIVEVRREDYKNIGQMKLRIERVERLMQMAFNQGRNYQADLVRGALRPNARPTH